jgi:hypothetical protein
MYSLPITRRLCLTAALLAVAGGATAEPLNPGRFKPFVDANRVDAEIAHVLNVLGSYPVDTWSREASDFAFAHLTSRVLIGMTRSSTAGVKLGPQLLPSFAAFTPQLVADIGRTMSTGGFQGYTRGIGAIGSLSSYVLFDDTLTVNGTQPGDGREKLAFAIVHELNHVRNREQLAFMSADRAPSAGIFVDGPLAMAQGGQAALTDFAAELAASHVAWRCLREWDNRWRGKPIPGSVDPKALYQFALEQAEHSRATSPYLQTLVNRPLDPAKGDDFNRQVALWMRTMRSLMFVASIDGNVAVGNLFDAASAAAEAGHFRRPAEAADGALNYWSAMR